MVLTGFGVELTEAELCELCDCTPFGTEALKAIDVARSLGFTHSAKHTLSFEQLEHLVIDGSCPIVFVEMSPITGIKGSHAMVVVDVGQTGITVYDPLQGERILPKVVFETAWTVMHNLAILIKA
jgi:ABC-type bacteriocin/lantibiotic exporter with double-glycine peptidase domain